MENVCVDAIIIVKLVRFVLFKDHYSFIFRNLAKIFVAGSFVYLHKNRRNLWQII